MIRAVIDTNVLIVIVARTSPYHFVWQALLKNEFELCVTTDILEEYEEILGSYYSQKTAEYVLNTFENLPNIVRLTKHYRLNLIHADPDDNKFADAALFSGSGYIVTHDHHFDPLKKLPFPKLTILTLPEFVALLGY
jgi:uncharacterized protein